MRQENGMAHTERTYHEPRHYGPQWRERPPRNGISAYPMAIGMLAVIAVVVALIAITLAI